MTRDNQLDYRPTRIVRKAETWYQEGLNSATAVVMPSTGSGDSTGGRQCFLAYHPFKLPGQGRITGCQLYLTNANASAGTVFYPRLKFDFLLADGTKGGPSTRMDTSYTPDILHNGVGAGTQYTGIQLGGNSGSRQIANFTFTNSAIVPYSAAELWMFVAIMCEQNYTADAAQPKTALTMDGRSGNSGWKWQNNAGDYFANPGESLWLGTLGLDITAQAFPSTPAAAAITSWGNGAGGAQANTTTTHCGLDFGLFYQEFIG